MVWAGVEPRGCPPPGPQATIFVVSSQGRGGGEVSSISFVNGINLIDSVLHPSETIRKGFGFNIWILRVHKTVYSSSVGLLLQIYV